MKYQMMTTATIFYSALLFFISMFCLAVTFISIPGITNHQISHTHLYKFFQEGSSQQQYENQTIYVNYTLIKHPPLLVFDSKSKMPYFLPKSTLHINKSGIFNKSGYKEKLITIYQRPQWFELDRCSGGMPVCPVSCACSDDINDVTRADAVVFSGVKLPRTVPERKTSQVWIFYGTESTVHYTDTYKLPQWKGVFNWTMTYHLDSDIVLPISILFRAQQTKKNYTKIALSKTKSAAWLVSNCHTQSKREMYVKALQEYYTVDIYGQCGPTGRVIQTKVKLLHEYKFYLSFENSLCVDYITEKFYDLYDRRLDVVPIVRGGADYRKLVPGGTYINTADFSSPKALAGYLKYLERNVTAFAALLQEKDKYESVGTRKSYQSAFCEICVRLHGNESVPAYDTATWISHKKCRTPNDF